MGVWNELQTLGEEYVARLPDIYASREFPYEIRGLFADWFEQQNWNFDENNTENFKYANELLSALMEKLEEFCLNNKEDLMSQMRNLAVKKQFADTFSDKAQYFIATVRDILTEEKQLLAANSMNNININTHKYTSCTGNSTQYNADCDMSETEFKYNKQAAITPSLEELNDKVVDIDSCIKEYCNNQEDFVIQHQNIVKMNDEMQSLSGTPICMARNQQVQQLLIKKKDVEQTLTGKAELLVKHRIVVMNHLFSIQMIIHTISRQIMEELFAWRVLFQKSLSGAPTPGPLDEIQTWFESLTDILWHFYSLAVKYKILFDRSPITSCSDDKEKINSLLTDIVNNLTQLIMKSFVVDKQPPQVMKTQTKFQASVRLLVGSKLNLQMNCPEVSVSILSEKQCKELIQGKTLQEVGTCGQILNDKCMMEHNKGSSNNECAMLQAEFKNLQLKNIQRKDRKGQESVLEAKSALVFSAELKISGGDSLTVMVMSVPVVVVVHGNQIPNSEATVVWDNMFSSPAREPFVTPDSVSWKEMSIALNSRWMLSNESELHFDHLMFLRHKIYSIMGDVKFDFPQDTKIPWSLFNKEAVVKGKNFTFWEWFYGAIEVVKKNLKEYWKFNCLELCTKDMCKMKLLEKNIGTFMIRFSESDIGAISIAYCGENDGQKEVMNLKPWNTKDFSIRNLADRIFDIPNITHLFPDITKEEAFGIFKTNEVSHETNNNGYVDTGIIACILPTQHKSENKPLISRLDFSQTMNYHSIEPLMPFNEALCDSDVLGPATIQADIKKVDFQKMLADVNSWPETR